MFVGQVEVHFILTPPLPRCALREISLPSKSQVLATGQPPHTPTYDIIPSPGRLCLDIYELVVAPSEGGMLVAVVGFSPVLGFPLNSIL